jgi:hypothetical protein
MSEFQVYKFRSVDRALTIEERKKINSWSSRTTATANSATFTYSYSGFSQKEEKVLAEYFDILLYFSNWGTRRLMLKFPRNLIDEKAIQKYTIIVSTDYKSSLDFLFTKDFVILDFSWTDSENGSWLEEDDFDSSDFINIREAILAGDYSALYLFWLKLAEIKASDEEYDDEYEDEYDDENHLSINRPTPPVPPALKNQGDALASFIEFFEINQHLASAAQEISATLADSVSKQDYSALIRLLSEEEKEAYLLQVLNGTPRVDLQLKKQLDGFSKSNRQTIKTVTLSELKVRQAEIEIREKKKDAEAKHQAFLVKMAEVAKVEDRLWKEVYENIQLKTSRSYDLAVETLVDLKALAAYRIQLPTFNQKMMAIKGQTKSKALLDRFTKAKL